MVWRIIGGTLGFMTPYSAFAPMSKLKFVRLIFYKNLTLNRASRADDHG
jgi:hypothetical protein